MSWPDDYPFRPPSLWETAGWNGDVVDHGATGHVYSDGSLCLFAHDAAGGGWLPEMLAAEMVDRFATFCALGVAGVFDGALRRPVEVDAVRVSIPRDIAHALRNGGDWGLAKALIRPDHRMILVTYADNTRPGSIASGSIERMPSQSWLGALGFQAAGAGALTGIWCRIAWSGATRNREELVARIRAQHRVGAQFILHQPMVLIVDESGEFSFAMLQPSPVVAALLRDRGDPLVCWKTVVEDIPSKLFARLEGRLSSRTALHETHVAVVGCGSIGSRVAIDLVKAGVGAVTLFDPEVMEPENVSRHVGTIAQIGLPKVDVVRAAAHAINPDVRVLGKHTAISLDPASWTADSADALGEVLDHPNGLVVCTAAADDVDRVINALCVARGCPAIYGWVMGRAEYGRIFRVIPGESPCYACVGLAQAESPGRFPQFALGSRQAERPSYRQPGIPGIGFDVDQVASLIARMALQTLGRRLPVPLGYPDSHGHHLLWASHGGWALDGPLQVRVEAIPRAAECPVCGPGVAGDLDNVERAALDRLTSTMTRIPGSAGGPQ